jgi:malate dehydrogenase (oxaloacetate-decarboxylating)
MILAAARAVADEADVSAPGAALLPTNAALRTTSSVVALQVAKAAQEQGVAQVKLDVPVEAVRKAQWWPEYCPVVAV